MIIQEIIKFLIFLIPINPFEEVIEVLSNCSRISFVHVTMFASKRGRLLEVVGRWTCQMPKNSKVTVQFDWSREKDNFEVLIRNTWSQKWFYFTIFTESARLILKKCLIAPYGQYFTFSMRKYSLAYYDSISRMRLKKILECYLWLHKNFDLRDDDVNF